MSPADLAEVAFKLHDDGRIDHDVLVSMLESCVNIAALENGYAETHGLPFPIRCGSIDDRDDEEEDEDDYEEDDEDDDEEDDESDDDDAADDEEESK